MPLPLQVPPSHALVLLAGVKRHVPFASQSRGVKTMQAAGVHVTGAPGTQPPSAAHESPSVQLLVSLQEEPVITAKVQVPVPAWQTPVAKHAPGGALQTTGVPAHAPLPSHRSVVVHASPSEHTVVLESAA